MCCRTLLQWPFIVQSSILNRLEVKIIRIMIAEILKCISINPNVNFMAYNSPNGYPRLKNALNVNVRWTSRTKRHPQIDYKIHNSYNDSYICIIFHHTSSAVHEPGWRFRYKTQTLTQTDILHSKIDFAKLVSPQKLYLSVVCLGKIEKKGIFAEHSILLGPSCEKPLIS